MSERASPETPQTEILCVCGHESRAHIEFGCCGANAKPCDCSKTAFGVAVAGVASLRSELLLAKARQPIALKDLPYDVREAAVETFYEGLCEHCLREDPTGRCQCWNDE